MGQRNKMIQAPAGLDETQERDTIVHHLQNDYRFTVRVETVFIPDFNDQPRSSLRSGDTYVVRFLGRRVASSTSLYDALSMAALYVKCYNIPLYHNKVKWRSI